MINRDLILSGTTQMTKKDFFEAIHKELKSKGFFQGEVNLSANPTRKNETTKRYYNKNYEAYMYYFDDYKWSISISFINAAKDFGY